jgi:hypothetical protein
MRRHALWIVLGAVVVFLVAGHIVVETVVRPRVHEARLADRRDDVPTADRDELDEAIEAVAAQQSAAGADVELIAHAGYRSYAGVHRELALEEGTELVAVDVELHVRDPYFDLDDIDVVVNGENLGSGPSMQPLTPAGQPVDWDDLSESEPFRVLLVYAVPAGTTAVSLAYAGRTLTEAPIPLDDTGAPAMLE